MFYMRWPKKRLLSLIFAAALVMIGCKESKEQTAVEETTQKNAEGGAVMENRSRIVATVLDVMVVQVPRFSLKLRIETIETVDEYAPAVEASQVIEAYPNFTREEGKAIDYTAEGNRHLLDARNLKTGDRITATVYKRANSFLLMDWRRE